MFRMKSTTKMLWALGVGVLMCVQVSHGQNSRKGLPDTLKGAKKVVYKTIGEGDDAVKLHLHIFFPKGHDASKEKQGKPAIVFFFGGGWNSGTPKQFEPHSRYLAARGMVAAVAEYRVRSRNKTTPYECVKDGKSAVRYLRENGQTEADTMAAFASARAEWQSADPDGWFNAQGFYRHSIDPVRVFRFSSGLALEDFESF